MSGFVCCAALTTALGFVPGETSNEPAPVAFAPRLLEDAAATTKAGNRFSLYGFLRLDAVFDDSRPQNAEIPGWILSEDPTAPPGVGAGGENRNDFTMHTRLTRLGLDFSGPEVGGLGDPVATGKVEVDFYNIGLAGQAPSRAALRMRHAYGKLDWDHASLLAGQTSDLISPLYPAVNNDLVMWGAGNLGDRRPQIRGEYRVDVDASTLLFQSMLGLTGAVDTNDFDSAGTFGAGIRDGESSGLPTVQGRVAYKGPFQDGTLEVGAWAHLAWEDPDTEFGQRRYYRSRALGLDAQVPIVDNFSLKGEIWNGKNLDDVRGGIFQGVNTAGTGEIHSRGGFAELVYKLNAHVTLHGGITRDNPSNRDLPVGGRSSNRVWYLASRASYGPIELGLEYLNWTTGYVGFDEGDDNRLAGYIAYRF